jgi:ribosome-associated protein
MRLDVTPQLSIPADEFAWTFARSSGPGGQNVNKVSSKAQLRWNVRTSTALPDEVRARVLLQAGRYLTSSGDLVLTSQRYRDQGRNVQDCLDKLRRLLLAAAVPPKRRRPTRPTQASRQRRLEGKQAAARKKRLRRPPQGD